MKKMLNTFVIISSLIYAQEYSVEDLIEVYRTSGYERRYEDFEFERLENQLEEVNRIDANGVDLSWDSNYTTRANESGETTLRLDYDIFNVKTTYDFLEGDLYGSVGVEKDIKDLIFSEKEFNYSLFKADELITMNNLDRDSEDKILTLITLYKTYQNYKLELDLFNGMVETFEGEYEKLKKEYELGVATRLDYRYAEIRYENLVKDINSIKGDMDKTLAEINEKFSLGLDSEATLLPFEEFDNNIVIDLSNIGMRDMETLSLEKQKAETNYDYAQHMDIIPEMRVGADYYLDSNDWRINFSMTKSFWDYNGNLVATDINLREFKVREEELMSNLAIEKADINNRYDSLLVEVNKYTNEVEVKEMEYLINQKRYEQGDIAYIDYIDSFDDYKEVKTNLIKKENELNALVMEIKYRR